jgi:dienelactone hydrolase
LNFSSISGGKSCVTDATVGTWTVSPQPFHTCFGIVAPFSRPALQSHAAGRDWLWSRSPLSRVDKIRQPLLIGHGQNDVRCKLAESEQIVAAMRERGLPVRYLVYPDEGHGFIRPENRLSFLAMEEAFYAEHLGTRCEPAGDDLAGSSLTER